MVLFWLASTEEAVSSWFLIEIVAGAGASKVAVADYSPTKVEDHFGQFEFCFESCNDYTKDLFEAVAMQVYVLNESVVKVSGYDI